MTGARGLGLAGLGLALVAAALWLGGAGDTLQGWAIARQEEFRATMAGALRALRAGQPGAVFGLIAVAFGYGLAHAAGPGHGKVLLGGYGLSGQAGTGRRGALRLIGLSLAASLAQATTAVLLVYGGVLALGWGRERIAGLAEGVLDRASYAAIAGLGLWIALRGLRRWWHLRPEAAAATEIGDHHHGHGHHSHPKHDHDHGADCGCGHAHGPTLQQAEAVSGLRDALLLVGGIAIRPCTGAVFLLLLCWRMGLDAAGIAGAYAMGIGTALVSALVALAAHGTRGSVVAALAGRAGRVLPLVEVLAGGLVTIVALRLLFPAG